MQNCSNWMRWRESRAEAGGWDGGWKQSIGLFVSGAKQRARERARHNSREHMAQLFVIKSAHDMPTCWELIHPEKQLTTMKQLCAPPASSIFCSLEPRCFNAVRLWHQKNSFLCKSSLHLIQIPNSNPCTCNRKSRKLNSLSRRSLIGTLNSNCSSSDFVDFYVQKLGQKDSRKSIVSIPFRKPKLLFSWKFLCSHLLS